MMRQTKQPFLFIEIADNTYIVLGTMTLNDFNEYFETDLESDNVDTIAGFI